MCVFTRIFFPSLIGNSNTINLRVRVTASHGLLLWAGGRDAQPSPDFIMIGVDNGIVQVGHKCYQL